MAQYSMRRFHCLSTHRALTIHSLANFLGQSVDGVGDGGTTSDSDDHIGGHILVDGGESGETLASFHGVNAISVGAHG